MPRCAFLTLGCKVNQYDTQAIREALARLGWDEAPPEAEAEAYVVNTCCVTHESHRKGLQAIRRIAREHPHARIIVTGCSVDADADSIRSIPGVACVLPNDAKPLLAALIAGGAQPTGLHAPPAHRLEACATQPPLSGGTGILPVWPTISRFAGHTRAFVKIEDGCNDFCSYCIVPHVRGRVRSRPPDEVVAEVARLVANGYLEVVLTGIHLGAYGLDASRTTLPEIRNPKPEIRNACSLVPRPRCSGSGLVPLVERLLATPGLRRLRLSSLDLREVTDDLIALAADSPVLCPHFHIPLQSGDDGVLRAMNRRYAAADLLRRLDAIRARIPDPALTTDIIVGFPGETDAAFRRTLAVARRAAFSRIHIFPYSDRPGTPASALPGKLPPATIKARREELKGLASELMAAYHRRFVGATVEPLVESRRDPRTGLLVGYTERYVRTLFPGPDALRGSIVPVRVTSATPAGLRGEPAPPPYQC